MNKPLFKRLFLAWIILALLTACTAAPSTAAQKLSSNSSPATAAVATSATTAALSPTRPGPRAPDYWPTQGWRSSTPEKQGMDSVLISTVFDAVPKIGEPVDSFLIVRNGYMVTEAYYAPFRPGASHNLVTATETIVSILIGIAIQQGFIKSTEQKMLDYFPDRKIDNMDARKQAVTIRNLLTMTSGFIVDDGGSTTGPDDGVQYQLNLRMVADPGKVWDPARGGYTLLTAIIQKATGMTALAFANKALFGPLGISDAVWEVDSKGIENGGNRMYLSSLDMAKIGFLYLNNGTWNGQQIVSKDYVLTSTQHLVDATSPYGYGYGWWTASDGSYSSEVGVGQLISVKPDQGIVTVFTASTAGGDSAQEMDIINNIIVPAVKSSGSLPDNPAGLAELNAKITALGNDAPKPILPMPALAATISGKKYLLDSGETFTLTFTGDQAALDWSMKDQSIHLPIGMDNVFLTTPTNTTERLSLFGADPKTVSPGFIALRGSWSGPDTFELIMQLLDSTRRNTVDFSFTGDKVTVKQSNVNSDETTTVTFQGQVQSP